MASLTRFSLILTSALFFGCAPSSNDNVASKVAPAVYVKQSLLAEIDSGTGMMTVKTDDSRGQTFSPAAAARTELVWDTTGFKVPAVSNQLLNFGIVRLLSIYDNDLKVCGKNANQKCEKALIRIYSKGTSGAGLYNEADQYGIPVKVVASGSGTFTVPLSQVNAVVVHTYPIPKNAKDLDFKDLGNLVNYQFTSDFTNAGAGSFTTTIVIEYALSL